MANDSFNLFVSSFVSFSINGLKENAENLYYYPIVRRKVELYLFLSTHRESLLCRILQMLSTAKGTKRENSSKPLEHSIVKRILVFKR